jgi:hypothetical protein
MAFWDDIKNIFNQSENSSASNPTIHEMIERTEDELASYERWKRTAGSRRLLDWLSEQYDISRNGGRQDESMGFLDLDSSKGFVIYIHKTNYSQEEMTWFFDFLKEKVQSLNYRSDISDRRIFPRRDWVEAQERHYLKPRIRYDENPMPQGFGNIMIEFESRNDIPHNLRLRATVYNDSMFKDAGSFRALMMALVSE